MKSTSKISIFCVGNGGLAIREDGFYENRNTAHFLVELGQNTKVTYCQPAVDFVHSESLSNYNLSNERKVRLLALPWQNTSKFRKLSCYFSALPKLVEEIIRTDYLYLFMPGNLSLICGILAIIIRKPFGVYLRGEFGIDGKMSRPVSSKSKFVLGTGSTLCEKARQFCRHVEIVSPMIDLAAEDLLEEKCYRECGPWRFLYVGRVEKRKGIGSLIEAAVILKEQGIDFELILAGGGPQLKNFKVSLPKDLKNIVRFLGTVSNLQQIRELYKQADLFLFPSYDEGFPRVLYEAMAFGTPIITTFVGSIPSLMKDRVNCFRVEVGDSQGIASRVTELLNNVELRRSLAQNAIRSIEKTIMNWKKSHALQVTEKFATLNRGQKVF